ALFALWRQAAAGGERRRHAQLRGCARATARLRGGLLLGAVVAWQAACAARRAAAVHAVGLRRRRQACEACSLIALSGRALLMLVGAFAWWRRALSAALLARMASRARGLQEARDAAAALLAAERSRALLGAAFAQWRAAEASLEGAGAHKRSSGPRREAGAASRAHVWLAAVLVQWHQAARGRRQEAALRRAGEDGRSRGLREARGFAVDVLVIDRRRSLLGLVWARWRESWHAAKSAAAEAALRGAGEGGRSLGLREARGFAVDVLAIDRRRSLLEVAWATWRVSWHATKSAVAGAALERARAARGTAMSLLATSRCRSWLAAVLARWWQMSQDAAANAAAEAALERARADGRSRGLQEARAWAAGLLAASHTLSRLASVFTQWRHASQLGARVTATEAELARVRADSLSSGLRDARIGVASLLAASCDRSWLAAVLTKWYLASQLAKRTTAAEAADARSHKLREALDVAAGHLTTSRSRFHIAAVFAEWRHASQLGAKVTATEAELARVRADSRSSGLRNARIGAASLLAASCDRSWLAAVLTKWYIASQLTKRTTAAEAADARSHKLREALDVAAGHLTTSRSRFHIAAVFAEWRHAFQAAARSAAYEKALERACADNRSRGFRDGRECAANFLATRLSHYWLATACMEWHRVSQLAATRTAADSLADSFAATRSAALQNAYADGRMHGLREIKDNVARVLANIHSLSWVAAVFAVWCRVSQLASKSAAAEAALRTACAEARSSGLQAARGIAASILATSCDRSWLTSVFVEWCRVSQLATTSAAMGAKLQRAGADGRLRGSIESRERAASLLAATRSRSWLAALLACWFQASRLEALMRWRTRYSQDLALWKQLAGKSQHHNSLLMSFHGWQRATSKAKVDTLRGRSKIMLLDRMISQMQEGLMIVLAEWRRAHAVCALRRSAEVQAEGSARRLAVACRLQAVRGCEWLLGLSCRRPAALAAALLEWRRRATRALLRRTVSAVAARSHRLQLAGLLSEWRGAAAASAERARAREGLRRGLEALGACALRGCSRRRVAAAWAAWQ
ncbi:unnamed protein product, partial [Prorocentrum cordatum]